MKHSRDELLELAAAYALGATTPDETAAIEAALATTPELVAEIASFREVVAAMSHAGSVAPSTETRVRLLERVRGDAFSPKAGVSPAREPRWTTRGRITAAAAGIIIIASLATESF